jgi:hypothetical protein
MAEGRMTVNVVYREFVTNNFVGGSYVDRTVGYTDVKEVSFVGEFLVLEQDDTFIYLKRNSIERIEAHT